MNTKSTELDQQFEMKTDKDFTHQVIAHLAGNALIGFGIAVAIIYGILSLLF